ncbi:type IV pilus modification protein PilV [Shewanella yunxiaonensis]|uniref:Type IV pilus modification protein PilV n=1 Tax=Shewanella yunxiaonensis TaxID=2829809 RepID=A0ABX7YQ78_9GAMM|nr:type IV pilus modification protein PilV [Shewanella yunxiaonensis]QUN04914.1 type IV pilus modification protein PilV [Shewanella yunxiaonensis]
MKSKRAGFSLIEVMVALVILVIGLIGIFNLHIVAKRASFESFEQTQAAYLANDILNRMKLNKTVLANYAGTYGVLGSETAPTSCDKAGVTCSPANMELWDIYQWRWLFSGGAEINASGAKVGGLDSTTACITVGTDNSVTIAIAWKGIQGTAGTTNTTSTCGSTLGTKRRLYVLDTVVDQG